MKIAAGLIVKNEEHDLPECLESIERHVSYIVIVDTGSTDSTEKVCQDFCHKHDWDKCSWEQFKTMMKMGLKPNKTLIFETFTEASELENGDWKLWDFSMARNQYLDFIDQLPEVTHLLSMDADDVLDPKVDLRALLSQISYKCVYSNRHNTSAIQTRRPSS
jgi:glycosyltransferase involved in cell wall biosynthesis